jgi:hypothetical protein
LKASSIGQDEMKKFVDKREVIPTGAWPNTAFDRSG